MYRTKIIEVMITGYPVIRFDLGIKKKEMSQVGPLKLIYDCYVSTIPPPPLKRG